MRIKHLLIIAIIISHQLISAQTPSREFGNVSLEELKMTEYEDDRGAEAVVLFDLGESYFYKNDRGGFDVVFERITRIKIFSEAGLELAQVKIPYYQDGGIYEKVYEVEAVTYNFENGRINKSSISQKDIYEEKINENWNAKKIAMPSIKKGSIIEYKYKIRSQYIFNLRDWEFQWGIPVVYSEYITRMVPFFEYTWLLQGASKFDSHETYKRTATTWSSQYTKAYSSKPVEVVDKYVMEKVPAFRGEEFITSRNDYIIKLDFQLSEYMFLSGGRTKVMTTWPALIKDYIKHADFGRFAKKSEKFAEKLLNVEEIKEKPAIEKFNIVMDYVKKNYNWNKQNRKFASKSPNQFVKDKYGNSADINLFTIGLLNGVGIDANPIIISTREHGKIKMDYPFAHFFNYVLIQATIDGKIILADATENSLQNERIPIHCINDAGLVIKKDEETWLNLACNFPSTIKTNVIIDSIGTDLSAQISVSATEYDAYNLRKKYVDDKKKIKEKLEEDGYEVEESAIEIKNVEDFKKPYSVTYKFEKNAEFINDKIYISPFFNEPINENPLKQKTRDYPIDMVYPTKRVYTSAFKIPKGYKLDYIGKDYDINNEYFAFQYKSNVLGEYIQVTLSYYFKKPVYAAKDYLKIKLYFKEIIKRANEKVVLVKT
jgi:hypothetical protein